MSYEQLFSTIYTGTPEEMKCIGYKRNPVKRAFFTIFVVLTLGFFKLVMHWKPVWEIKLTHSLCSLAICDVVILVDKNEDSFVEQVIALNNSSLETVSTTRYFKHECLRYFWDTDAASFIPLRVLEEDVAYWLRPGHCYLEICGFEPKCSELLDGYHGISDEEKEVRKYLYGPNLIEHNVRSYWRLLIDEVLHPFYIFQIFSIILWCNDNYYYYAACIFVVSCISMGISLYETKKQDITLHDMIVSHSFATIEVSRQGKEYSKMPTFEIVPGDLIIIPEQGCLMNCDAVLITGNCIVNESMLTGESVPVTKTPLTAQSDSELYSPGTHKRHTLFCGTEIVQTRYYGHSKVMAVVIRTGFLTAKGELVRSIMFPKPINLYRDAMYFILVLFAISMIGFGFTIYWYIQRRATPEEVILRSLDIFTVVIPPSLPAALTVGTIGAQRRLKKEGIFCISPQRINESGKIKTMCFDKTGTLTEDGLDLHAVILVEKKEFTDPVCDPSSLPVTSLAVAAMATCHSLTLINKQLTGDPLDIKMFEATKWELEEPGEDSSRFDLLMPTVVHPVMKFSYQMTAPMLIGGKQNGEQTQFILNDSEDEIPYEIGIVRQFTFSSSLQCMSVIVRRLGASQMDVYVKGAPEKISSLCHSETVPADFLTVLHKYSIQGFRVLALAHKSLSHKVTWHQVQKIKRDVVESKLSFLGLLLMQNALKRETKSVIRTLHKANIRIMMVTGDNILTAVSVARECKIISSNENLIFVKGSFEENGQPSSIEYKVENDEQELVGYEQLDEIEQPRVTLLDMESHQNFHFALDGKAFRVLRSDFTDTYHRVLVRGVVFARMAPDQKTQLIEDLQKLNYIVGMCGDGANDCGALKVANVGISLSEAEASVAAPFTSKIQDITCVPTVMKNGRCALVTSLGVFKFMALYSMIQFISVILLYTRGCILGDIMYLYIDLITVTTIAILMSLTEPYAELVHKRPLSNLINAQIIFAVVMHSLISAGGQLASLYFLESQAWHNRKKVTPRDQTIAWETSVIFFSSCLQYISMSFTFSKGPPYRQPIYKNILFSMALFVLASFSIFLWLEPVHAVTEFFDLNGTEFQHINYKLYVILIVAANFFVYVITEEAIGSATFKKIVSFIKKKNEPRNIYNRVNLEIEKDREWPPINELCYSNTLS